MGDWLILVILAIMVVSWLWWRAQKPSSHPKARSQEKLAVDRPAAESASLTRPVVGPVQAAIPIDVFVSHGAIGERSAPDVGAITAVSDGEWVLNPQSPFPLTVETENLKTAEKIKAILDRSFVEDWRKAPRQIESILVHSDLKCREIEAYVEKYRPVYLEKIEQLKSASAEWNQASVLDREDLMIEFEAEALKSLQIYPYRGANVLLRCRPSDLSLDDSLIERFGYEVMRIYALHDRQPGKVRAIPADSQLREQFEKLADAGLALRGRTIPTEKILDSLKLKEMENMVADLDHPSFTRKAKAVSFLLGLSDISERLSRVVTFRELFELLPLPAEFDGIDWDQVRSRWRYASEVAEIMSHTYFMGAAAMRNYSELEAMDSVTGWQIHSAPDSCPSCRKASTKQYAKRNRPRVPLHIGCRCNMSAKFKWD